MRDFFITWMERLLGLFVILSILGLIASAVMTAMSDRPHAMIGSMVMLIGGAAAIIVTFGFAYVALGIHANTRRTADAIEALARGTDGARTGSSAPAVMVHPGTTRRAGPPTVHGPVKPDSQRR